MNNRGGACEKLVYNFAGSGGICRDLVGWRLKCILYHVLRELFCSLFVLVNITSQNLLCFSGRNNATKSCRGYEITPSLFFSVDFFSFFAFSYIFFLNSL